MTTTAAAARANAPPSASDDALDAKLRRLRRLPVGALHDEFTRLYGSVTTSRNRAWLIRRCFHRVQELATGVSLSDAERARIGELGDRAPVKRLVRKVQAPDERPLPKPPGDRDPRLPEPGTVIERRHGDRSLHVLVQEHGFEVDGIWYKTLSEVAFAVTGTRWNGFLWAGLATRKPRGGA